MGRKRDMSKLEHRLKGRVGRAIVDFNLIEDGDRVLVAMSGGKDSYAMLSILDIIKRRAPVKFELVPWHLDQVQPGYDGEPLKNWLDARGGDYVIARQDTYSVVVDRIPEGKTYCSLCSRLRRGILYNAAVELGCTKIALGHHADDLIETSMLNQLFTGQLKTMPPWLRSDDGRNTVIRPLVYCWEKDLQAYSLEKAFPILPCNLCGSQTGMQRQWVKKLLADIEAQRPQAKESMFAALTHVRPTHLLDRDLWKKLDLGPGELPDRSGRDRLRIVG
jgi:tRNA 2-thiocytidine biosynthesis protein TtcA